MGSMCVWQNGTCWGSEGMAALCYVINSTFTVGCDRATDQGSAPEDASVQKVVVWRENGVENFFVFLFFDSKESVQSGHFLILCCIQMVGNQRGRPIMYFCFFLFLQCVLCISYCACITNGSSSLPQKKLLMKRLVSGLLFTSANSCHLTTSLCPTLS